MKKIAKLNKANMFKYAMLFMGIYFIIVSCKAKPYSKYY